MLYFVSLGCDKNLVDSEKMLGLLADRGYSFTDDEDEADAVVVNTCCFIGDAKEESTLELLRFAERRRDGSLRALIASGCLAQRYREEIQTEIPEVDALIGTTAVSEIADVLDAVLKGRRGSSDAGEMETSEAPYSCNRFAPLDASPAVCARRILSPGSASAFLKIAEGCGKNCTYCIIPKVRGPYRSVPEEALLAEARELAQRGVRELVLVAQETTLYGIDLYGRKSLAHLLRKLAELEGIEWIRILYAYPEEVDDDLIEAIASEPKVCHYLDIPIQHASDEVLRRMGRRTRQEELRERIARLRERIPDICLRTTLLTGFPGETQEDHEELYRFVNEMEFDRLGVFAYSQEEDTDAAEMPGQIPETVKEERRAELMELQQAVCFENEERMVGRELTALVWGRVAEDPADAWEADGEPEDPEPGSLARGGDTEPPEREAGDLYAARTYRDAPEVDGYLFFRSEREILSGEFVSVRVTGARGYDLTGELVR